MASTDRLPIDARITAIDRTAIAHAAVDRASDAWPPAVLRAVAYIESHLCEPICVEQLAASACMSRFHFARVFRASTGASPMEYLRLRRIERAQRMLGEGGRKVSQIASELCFFDQSHFVRSFRRITGCTPTRFAAGYGAGR